MSALPLLWPRVYAPACVVHWRLSNYALCAAGYSPKQARKGRAAIPAAVFELMTREELLAYESLGKKLLKDKKRLEESVVGFIFSRMAQRRDDGVKAATLLGQHCGVLKLTKEAHIQGKHLVIEAPARTV